MKNCLILGSGRSGTSMLGGILHEANYYLGEYLYNGNQSNPKGFFESPEINDINEAILRAYNKRYLPSIIYKVFRKTRLSPRKRQQWLLSIPTSIKIAHCPTDVSNRIKLAIKRQPFCFKDPRFSYTLPVWKRYLRNDTKYLCIFRAPNITVNSILKECSNRRYLKNIYIDVKYAYDLYINLYSHILTNFKTITDQIYFIHYEQILDGSSIPKLSEFLDADLSNKFADSKFRRTLPCSSVSLEAEEIYRRLCKLSGYR